MEGAYAYHKYIHTLGIHERRVISKMCTQHSYIYMAYGGIFQVF